MKRFFAIISGILLLAFALITCIIFSYHVGRNAKLYEWGLATKWHFFHDNKVAFQGLKVKLPLKWWVTAINEGQIDFTMVPPKGVVHCGILRLTKNYVPCDSLRKFEVFKIIGQTRVEFYGYDSLRIGDLILCGILFGTTENNGKMKNLFHIWTMPSHRIVITATGIPQNCESYYRSFLTKGLIQ